MTTRGQTIDQALALRSDADVLARLRLGLPGALEQLDRIASGNVQRNDAVILKGIGTILQYSQPLPKQQVEHSGAVGISVIDPYAEPAGSPAVPASQQTIEPEYRVLATPPFIRRRSAGEGGGPGLSVAGATDPSADNFAVPTSASLPVTDIHPDTGSASSPGGQP